jgi:hypothetical protein
VHDRTVVDCPIVSTSFEHGGMVAEWPTKLLLRVVAHNMEMTADHG